MGLTLLQRRFSAWLAMLALVLGGLAPVLTQALAAGPGGAGWAQICSASGMAWVQIEAPSGGDAPAQDGPAASGCTWCQHHGAAGLPPVALAPLPPAGRPPQVADAVREAVLVPRWPQALGRAPPALT